MGIKLKIKITYLNEHQAVNSLGRLVRAGGEVLIDVLEVGHEHILHKVLILLDIVLLEKDLITALCLLT